MVSAASVVVVGLVVVPDALGLVALTLVFCCLTIPKVYNQMAVATQQINNKLVVVVIRR